MRVTVLEGGSEGEADVSVKTAAWYAANYERLGHSVRVRGVHAGQLSSVMHAANTADVLVNGTHGGFGEDGTLQGVLETLGVPYTNSGVLASALGMNKRFCAAVLRAHGDLAADIEYAGPWENHPGPFGFDAVVKPESGGSSNDVTFVGDGSRLRPGAYAPGLAVLVERWLPGPEYTVALRGDEVVGVLEISVPGPVLDRYVKYGERPTRVLVEGSLGYDDVADAAYDARSILGTRGVCRVDVRMDEDMGPRVIDVNTQPGMRDASLYVLAVGGAGRLLDDILEWQLTDAGLHR